MRVELTIISMLAVADGLNDCFWRGDVELEDGDPSFQAEQVFRLFNRVSDADVKRLAKIVYELPSLSVGDLIVFSGHAFRIETSGFKQLDLQEQLLSQFFPEGASASPEVNDKD